MRIAIISDWFSEKMGYAENCLPKALASLGHEVHLITTDAQVYFNSPSYKETYESFIGPPLVPCGVKALDGYTLHRLPRGANPIFPRGALYIKSLIPTLMRLRPDVVQTLDVACQSTRDVALAKAFLGYVMFMEAHTHASVFVPSETAGLAGQLRDRATRALNRLSSVASSKCYAISADAANVAVEHFGLERDKVAVCSLGVDTDLFRPLDEATRQVRRDVRQRFGFSDEQVVCVYTGRLTLDKGPGLLAEAVDRLVARGLPFGALFVGRGTQADVDKINACRGCVVHPFVPFHDLPPYYLASDLGVWPKQESTSQLDAAACGLPIVISNKTEVPERIEGNGLTYEENDPEDLARVIQTLQSPERRAEMGRLGSEKIRARFSWKLVAEERLKDYRAALGRADQVAA